MCSTFSSVEIKRKVANPMRKLRRIYFTCFCIFTAVVNILCLVGRPYFFASLVGVRYSEYFKHLLISSELNYFPQKNSMNNDNNNNNTLIF
jgi:hypothetical protein